MYQSLLVQGESSHQHPASHLSSYITSPSFLSFLTPQLRCLPQLQARKLSKLLFLKGEIQVNINWWKYRKTLLANSVVKNSSFLPSMWWQFYYIFSKFTGTRCSPDKLISFQAFYHINKISPQESKIISSTSWFNPSLGNWPEID